MLLDFQMPLKNGIDVVKEMQAYYKLVSHQARKNQIELQEP